jgi:hypothetical protein
MKKTLLILIMVLMPTILLAQTFIDEDFSGGVPPAGWTGDAHISNWHDGASNNAGGSVPEMVFDWDPQFNGTARIISPQIDLTGVTTLYVQFKHMIDHYSTPYTVGVATRAGTGTWHVVWQTNPTGNVGPQTLSRVISNADVGASNFQICWFFTGDSYYIDYWYIDDILLYSPLNHDVKIADIAMESQYEPNATILPSATAENFGLNSETFDVSCQIKMGPDVVFTDMVTGVTLNAGQSSTVTFSNFTIPVANEMYEISVATLLPGDQQPANDTLVSNFNTYTTERDMVMVEIGTGTWCVYCPGSAMGADELVENGYNVAVLEHHAYNEDPYENESSLARVLYYGITGFPTAVFDGVDKFIGGSNTQSMYQYYVPLVEARAAIKSAFSIGIYGDHTGDNYNLAVVVDKNARIPYENMALHVGLTESGISYNWQGQNHLEYVERLMLPSADGTPLDFESGDRQTINLNFTLDSEWDVSECELVAFIQNLDNKEILQGTKVMVPDLLPLGVDDEVALPAETKLVGNYPNPFNPSTTIQFSLKQSGNARVEVFNLLGQKITTLINERMEAGNHSLVWSGKDSRGNDVSSGIYFYKLVTDDYSSTRKMALTK